MMMRRLLYFLHRSPLAVVASCHGYRHSFSVQNIYKISFVVIYTVLGSDNNNRCSTGAAPHSEQLNLVIDTGMIFFTHEIPVPESFTHHLLLYLCIIWLTYSL